MEQEQVQLLTEQPQPVLAVAEGQLIRQVEPLEAVAVELGQMVLLQEEMQQQTQAEGAVEAVLLAAMVALVL